MYLYLSERLTFDQLFRASEPKRIKRSSTVRGPPLQITAYSDQVWHSFNFKAHPSTTGLRHHGYIRFYRPRQGQSMPLQHVPCMVDCTCPDFRYRWAWVLKQRKSSMVGTTSMNQALNLPPDKTNPRRRIGLCKHILAARDYIYGMLSAFPGGEKDPGETLVQLVRYGQGRWEDFPAQTARAKEREAWFKAAKQARNAGLPVPPGPPEPYRMRLGPGILPAAGEENPPAPEKIPEPKKGGPVLPKRGRPTTEPGRARAERPKRPGRPGRPARGESREVDSASVDRMNGPNLTRMKLTEAIKIVEDAAVDLPPSEPPVSDTAVGADTQGNVVVQLLTDIKDLMGQLVDLEAGEEAAEGGEDLETAVEVPEPDVEGEEDLAAPAARPMPPE